MIGGELNLPGTVSIGCRLHVSVVSILLGRIRGRADLRLATDDTCYVALMQVIHPKFIGWTDSQYRIKINITRNSVESVDISRTQTECQTTTVCDIT